jgi:hypothetical protein
MNFDGSLSLWERVRVRAKFLPAQPSPLPERGLFST